MVGNQKHDFNTFFQKSDEFVFAHHYLPFIQAVWKAFALRNAMEHCSGTYHKLQSPLSGMSKWIEVFYKANRNAGAGYIFQNYFRNQTLAWASDFLFSRRAIFESFLSRFGNACRQKRHSHFHLHKCTLFKI